MVGIVEIVGGAESLIFVEIGCLNGLVESVSVGLENIFWGTVVNAWLNVEPHCRIVRVKRMRTDSALIKFVVPGIREIRLIGSALLDRIPLKHCLGVVLHYSAGLDLLIAVDTA